ncbi:MAG: TIGR03619 family F420-dependent LLM class oxidoreductase [Actinobacteria bacterium]|nr:TIGR03619 family F420-dependent LLM class oxidoreductase [Actinomycetota bacterium]
MNPWLSVPFFPTERLIELARAAEDCGITGLALSDHLCVPPEVTSRYPYAPDGKAALPVDSEFPDPVVVAAALGAATTRLRFTTAVLVAPLRHPLLLAKDVATAAAITGGRFDLGVGIGWMREEFDAVGVPFGERGARLDETIEILRLAWSGALVEYRGRHFTFSPVAMNPVPPGGVTVFVGGHSDKALARAARLGDGWIGSNPTIEELGELLGRLRQVLRTADRDPGAFPVRTGFRGRLTDERLVALRDLGVTDVVLAPFQVAPSAGSLFEPSFEEVVARLPEVVDAVSRL